MAFAALHPEAGRIDATQADLGRGLSWDAVHKARPRVALRCPECAHGVHAKVSRRGLRYFAHDPGRPDDCAWLSESLEHHLLKLELATAVRAVGWHAELEVRAVDGSWRADVLATSHDGDRRVALEAQLSPITDDDILARTDRYRHEGIDVCWFTPNQRPAWLGVVPAVQVREPHDRSAWTVVDGIAGFRYVDGAWRTVTADLVRFIGWMLHGQAIVHEPLPRYRLIRLDDRRYAHRRSFWTTRRSAGEEARHEVMRQEQDERKRERQEREHRERQLAEAEAEARRLEEQRQLEIREAEARERIKQYRIEEERQWQLRAEQERLRRETEERLRQEQTLVAEQQRLEQEEQERLQARRWWDAVSSTQVDELRAAVCDPVWKQEGIRLVFDPQGPALTYGHGIAISRNRQLYGVLRPSPASLHRVPRGVPVFVRNAHEARELIDTGKIRADRVVHFDLPEFEQLSLI
ncbi:competence protein CoiA family protein [Actinosynnema sp. CA-299493]